MRFKIIVKYILLILWMILIFCFSAQDGNASGEMSDGFIFQVISIIEKIGNVSLDNVEITDSFVSLIRKIAHFSVYFVLGILLMNLLKEYRISLGKQVIYSLLISLIYACSDEIHQLFVPGRSGNLFDVMIDMLGCLCSIVLIYLFKKTKNRTV